jgi:hypothetical protein
MNGRKWNMAPRKFLEAFCVVSLWIALSTSCTDKGALPESYLGGLDGLTLRSLVKVNEYPFYVMRYYGDYGFSDYVRLGSGNADASVTLSGQRDTAWSCTCFVAFGSPGYPVFGRNFDWNYCVPLLLFTDPPHGYASVSMVDLEYYGYNRNNLPDDVNNRASLLRAPWLPFDGMNEKGVTVGMMAIPNARSPHDPAKITLGELEAIRLVLDFAGSTDEAIELLKKFNIRMETPPIHYLIADPTGRSAVVEFLDGTMYVMRNTEPWQVSTNFILYGSGAPSNAPCWRYNAAYNHLRNSTGQLASQAAMDLLKSVSQSTIWSIVYEMSTGGINVDVGKAYDKVLRYTLSDYVSK